jgi:hypothetical protein
MRHIYYCLESSLGKIWQMHETIDNLVYISSGFEFICWIFFDSTVLRGNSLGAENFDVCAKFGECTTFFYAPRILGFKFSIMTPDFLKIN